MNETDSESPSPKKVKVDFEKPLPDSPFVWWAALIGPLLLTILALIFVYFFQGWDVVVSYLSAAAAAFFIFGRFIILLGSDEPNESAQFFLKHLDATNLFCMLTWMDVMVAVFVASHMPVLFKIPYVGQKMEDLIADAKFILQYQPWIRRAAFGGLVGFVIFPTSTTGSIGGSIFGRLLGMTRVRIIIAILLGSVLGNGIMLLFADWINAVFPSDNIYMKILGVLAMIFALFLFERRIKTLKAKYLTQIESESSESIESNEVADNDPSTDA